MSDKLNRRELIRAGAAAGLAAALPHGALGQSPVQAPAVVAPKSAKPVVISSANGVRRLLLDETCRGSSSGSSPASRCVRLQRSAGPGSRTESCCDSPKPNSMSL